MPNDRCYLAIDLGASSGRAVLGTLEGAQMRMREVHRFRTPLVEEAGHLYWELATLEPEIREALRLALEQAPALRSVSVDSWAVDYVPLGEDGAPLRRPYAYRDSRTRGRMDEAARRVGADALYDRTGIQFLEINTLPQLIAEIDDEPDVAARTATRLLIADYFLYRLSGHAVAERTMASTTQLMDARAGDWAEEVLRAAGDEPARWPRIVAPGTTLGPVLPAAMPPGARHAPQVIASCSHDTAAAVVAVPATGEAPWAYICSGTWSLVGAELTAPVLSAAARAAGFTNEAGLDGTVRFLKNRTGMWVLEECIREWAEEGERPSYPALMSAADAAPSTGRTLDLNAPGFGERGGMVARLEAACRAAGFTPPGTRGGLVRLVLDSLAESYRATLAEMEALTGVRAEVVHVVGGGARNHLLNQLTADACGRRVVAGPEEASALGNLLVQARTLGDLPPGVPLREVARRSSRLFEYLPGQSAPEQMTALPID